MLLRGLFVLGLASGILALPTVDDVDGSVPGVYVTDSYTDHLGVEKRSTKAISSELHERLIYYSEYATAAYCPTQQGKAASGGKGGGSGAKITCQPSKTCPRVEKSDTKIYTTWLDSGNNSATGFVAADHTKKKIVISMRGSVSFSNWMADLKFFQTACPQLGGAKAMCNVGFYGFWQQSKPAAMKGLQQGLGENPNYDIIVTGHSLGAAAAVYAAGELRTQYRKGKKVELYSYGQPRAGNEEMSKFVTNQGNNYRVTHTSDAVPKLPPEYSPISMLTGNYYHISPEYWISDGVGMKIENIKGPLEGMSNNNGNSGTGQMKFNIVAHVQYFQTNMYYCVLPLPDVVGYGAGTKYIDLDFPDWPTSPADPRVVSQLIEAGEM